MVPSTKFTAEFMRISAEELKRIVESVPTIENYIRHPSTVSLLSRILQRPLEPKNGIYTFNGEVVILVTLAIPQRGQEVMNLEEKDIAIYRVTIKFE